MKTKIISLILVLAFSSKLFSQNSRGLIDISKVPVPQWHYQEEYTFDSPSDQAKWEKISTGLHAAFGSTDILFHRSEVPDLNEDSSLWKSAAWRGERKNSQIVIWSTDTLNQVRLKVTHLKDNQGNIIENKNISLHTVRYVLSDYPYNGIAENCATSMDSVWLMPDRLEPHDRFDLPGNSVRPVWLAIDIPTDTKPSKYRGEVEVITTTDSKKLQIEINVQEPILPTPQNWKFRLDLWQNPWVIAWYYHVEPWSQEHKLLLKNHMKTYADAGGTFITTYAVHSPWTDNSYMIEGGMIEWIKTEDEKWKFDYTVFDEYVGLCMELGVDKAITIYTPVPWGNRFRYLEEKSGNYIYESWPVESSEFKFNWNAFLHDLKQHLINKGWFGLTYLGINENPLDVTLASIKHIKEHSPDWKITYAGNWHPELAALIDDYSSLIPNEPSLTDIKTRKESGFTSTFYVCCNPAKPNNFVFSPPVEGRFMGWYAISAGYDGFLRWAYDAWPADPQRDARHTLWPAGDCFLVYPGGYSSIRFEKLREGIVDFEKIRILRVLANESKNENVKKIMRELEDHLDSFKRNTKDIVTEFNPDKMISDIQKGETLIEKISELLKQ